MKTNTATAPFVPAAFHHSAQPETIAAMEKLLATCPGSVAARDARVGWEAAEPLLVMMDSAIRLAKAYRARFDAPVGDDYMARPEISGILSGIRGMLNFDGGHKMELDARDLDARLTDSKDNGTIEALFWKACEIAGIDGNDV
jgi:hypothetical protein